MGMGHSKDTESSQDPGWAQHGAPAPRWGQGHFGTQVPRISGFKWDNWESSALPRPSQHLAPVLLESGPVGTQGQLLHQRSHQSTGCCHRGQGCPGWEHRGRAGCRNTTRGFELCLLGWDSVSLPMGPGCVMLVRRGQQCPGSVCCPARGSCWPGGSQARRRVDGWGVTAVKTEGLLPAGKNLGARSTLRGWREGLRAGAGGFSACSLIQTDSPTRLWWGWDAGGGPAALASQLPQYAASASSRGLQKSDIRSPLCRTAGQPEGSSRMQVMGPFPPSWILRGGGYGVKLVGPVPGGQHLAHTTKILLKCKCWLAWSGFSKRSEIPGRS